MGIVLRKMIETVVQQMLDTEMFHFLRNPRRTPGRLHQSQNLHAFAKTYSPQPSDLEPISAIALEQHARPDHQEG